MIASALRSTELNPAKLAFLFKKQFDLCQVKRGETIAMCFRPRHATRIHHGGLRRGARLVGVDAYEICVNALPSWTKVGVPTIGQCKGTLDALKQADMILTFHPTRSSPPGSRRCARPAGGAS